MLVRITSNNTQSIQTSGGKTAFLTKISPCEKVTPSQNVAHGDQLSTKTRQLALPSSGTVCFMNKTLFSNSTSSIQGLGGEEETSLKVKPNITRKKRKYSQKRSSQLSLLAMNKTLDYQDDINPREIWFCPSFLAMTGLPRRKNKGKTFVKHINRITITYNTSTEMPYGSMPMLIIMILATLYKHQENSSDVTREINLGTRNNFIKKLFKLESSASKTYSITLVNQFKLLNSLVISSEFEHSKGKRKYIEKYKFNLFEKIPYDENGEWDGRVILTDKFCKYLKDHAVPLDVDFIYAFQACPLKLTLYAFFTYAISQLKEDSEEAQRVYFSNGQAYKRFTWGDVDRKSFIQEFKEAVRELKTLCPQIKYSVRYSPFPKFSEQKWAAWGYIMSWAKPAIHKIKEKTKTVIRIPVEETTPISNYEQKNRWSENKLGFT